MKRIALFAALIVALAAPSLMMAQSEDREHAEFGVFADLFRLSRTNPNVNFIGLGARAGFNVSSHTQLEAEMNYDFKRNFSSTFSNGFSASVVNTRLRTLHAMFGPKFNTNVHGVRAFGTFKVGVVNFTASNQNAQQGFTSSLGSITDGNTRPAIYPGGGIEAFAGPIGLRVEAGDEIYFDRGARNNLRVTFGPQFRF
jgi:hypothetical protein